MKTQHFKKSVRVFLPLLLVAVLLLSGAVLAGAEEDKPNNYTYLNVGSNIVSNYYIDTAYYRSKGCDSLQYTYNGTSNKQEYNEVTSPMISIAQGDQYTIEAVQAAAQIAEPTVINIYKGGSVYDTISFSTKDYCDKIIEMNDETLIVIDSYGRPIKLRTLCKSIIAYGKAAQAFFPDYMSNPGAVAITDDYSSDLGFDSASYLPKTERVVGEHANFYSASFICTSSAAMRFYVSADSTVSGAPVVSGPDGVTFSNFYSGGKLKYVQVNNILPVFFDRQITVTYGDASIKMGVLDFAGTVIENTQVSAEFKDLAKSLIAHGDSTEEYFEEHTIVKAADAVAATCTAAGNITYYRCTDCGKLYSDANGDHEITAEQAVVPALGHAYVASVTAPTCTEQGYTTYSCSRCGDTNNNLKDNYTAALGHDFGDWAVITDAVAPTCTATGTTAVEKRTCSRCDAFETKGGDTVAMVAHTEVADAAVAATCTATGKTAGSHCSVCGTVIVAQTTTDALGHSYTAQTVSNAAKKSDATCTAAAVYYYSCSRCGAVESNASHTFTNGNALGHVNSWSVTTGATLTTTGTETNTCSRCNTVIGTRTVQNFTMKFQNTEDYLYRIGNANNVTLGSLFANASGANVSNVTATVTKNAGNAAGTFTANASDWRNSTLKFTGTGVVTVTLKHGTTTAATLKLEVVAATNATAATAVTSSKSIVLLNDVSITSSLSVAGGTLYGNGFTIDATGTADANGNTSLNSIYGAINLSSGTLNNVKVVGPVLKTAAVYSTKDSNFVYTVKTDGPCFIYNSYLSGSRSVIGMYGAAATSNLTIEDSVIDGGRFSNIFVRFGALNLHNVTTISQPRMTIDGKMRCGYGIVFSDEAGTECQLTATGYLKQYNWVGQSKDVSYFVGDNSNSDSNSVMSNLFSNMYSKASSLTVSYDGDTFINTGILSQNSTVPRATGSALSSYGSANISLAGTTGWVMTTTNLDATNDFKYYSETTYAPTNQVPTVPTFTWSYPSTYSSTEKQVNLSFESGGSVSFNPNILTASKYNNSLTVSATMGGSAVSNPITFDTAGDYTITYTITDPYNYAADGTTTTSRTYTKTLKVHVTETIVTINAPEFTFLNTSGGSLGINTKIVDIGGKHYVTLEGTPSDSSVTSTTVSGTTIYMPKVTVRFKDNSSDFNYKFPIFYGVNIKNYTDASGTSTTYNKSTSSMPSAVTRVSADPNWNGKTSFNSTSKDSTYGLCYVSAAIGSNQSARNATIQFKLTAGNGEEYYYYIYYDAAAHNKPSGCVAEGSMITMADGSKKAVEEIQIGDMVMTWSFWNGQYEPMPVGIKWYHGTHAWNVLTLKFSDGTEVRTINEHGFFDADKNTYTYITPENVDDFVGDKFVKQCADGSNAEVVLQAYTLAEEEVGCYSLQTVKNDNFLVEDIISITAEEQYPGKFEFFEVGEGMKYDEAKMQAEIEKYGLFTYDEWSEYLTEEEFYALNGPYYKILIGRGVLTMDDLIYIIASNVPSNQ